MWHQPRAISPVPSEWRSRSPSSRRKRKPTSEVRTHAPTCRRGAACRRAPPGASDSPRSRSAVQRMCGPWDSPSVGTAEVGERGHEEVEDQKPHPESLREDERPTTASPNTGSWGIAIATTTAETARRRVERRMSEGNVECILEMLVYRITRASSRNSSRPEISAGKRLPRRRAPRRGGRAASCSPPAAPRPQP